MATVVHQGSLVLVVTQDLVARQVTVVYRVTQGSLVYRVSQEPQALVVSLVSVDIAVRQAIPASQDHQDILDFLECQAIQASVDLVVILE